MKKFYMIAFSFYNKSKRLDFGCDYKRPQLKNTLV